MMKMSSCQKDMSTLPKSPCKNKGLTQMNSYYKMGSTLPHYNERKLRECIFSFSNLGLKREDSGLSTHAYTKKNLIFLFKLLSTTLDYIIVKCENLEKYHSFSLICINCNYLKYFHS